MAEVETAWEPQDVVHVAEVCALYAGGRMGEEDFAAYAHELLTKILLPHLAEPPQQEGEDARLYISTRYNEATGALTYDIGPTPAPSPRFSKAEMEALAVGRDVLHDEAIEREAERSEEGAGDAILYRGCAAVLDRMLATPAAEVRDGEG